MSNAMNAVRQRMAAITDVDPDTVLITLYVSGELSPEQRERVEARMATDDEFRRGVQEVRAIWALPEWVGLTDEDAEWLKMVRALPPEATDPERLRAMRSARRVRWLQAAAAIAGIAVLSGIGFEAMQNELRTHASDAPRVAASAPPVHEQRPAATPPRATASGGVFAKPTRTPTHATSTHASPRADSATPVRVAAGPDRVLPSAGTPPVVVATTKVTPHAAPLGLVVSERPCVVDPILSVLATRPDSEAPIKDLGKLLRIFAPRPRAGAISIGRTDLPVAGPGQGPAKPLKFCGDTTTKPSKR